MWNEGYTSEINYTSGYYAELSLARMRLALLCCGIDHAVDENPNYLELGFGQGLSLNINTATSSGNFYGTDFNPGQVANARELARAMGKPLTLLEDSFEELVERTDLPQFDVIALHGIWSWISDNARAAIVELARKSLKPGGVFYISYNVTPGWSPAWPLRTLLSEYAKRESAGTILDKVESSIGFVDRVIESNAAYFVQNPQLKARLETIKKMDRTYIAHEYFNANWDPMPFSKVADKLAEAKLTYAANASIIENISAISLPAGAHEVLQTIRDPIMRETTRDYFVNTQFRRDIFVKGARAISPYDLGQRIERERFMLLGDPKNCPAKVATVIGEAELRGELYRPLCTALAGFPDSTASIGELLGTKELKDISRAQAWEILLILTGAGFVAPLSNSTTPDADAVAAKALNASLLDRAKLGTGVDYLAAPRLGSALQVGRIDQLFIKALAEKEKDPVDWVFKLLVSQGQSLLVNGEMVQGEEANRAELKRMYGEFKEKREAMLRRVGAF